MIQIKRVFSQIKFNSSYIFEHSGTKFDYYNFLLLKIESDFKIYAENGISVGIGQCEVVTLRDLNNYKDAYIKTLDEVRMKNSLDWAMLMITDVIKETSVLLTTDFKLNKNIQYRKIENNVYDMPGVLSRKKQLLPDVLSLINQ